MVGFIIEGLRLVIGIKYTIYTILAMDILHEANLPPYRNHNPYLKPISCASNPYSRLQKHGKSYQKRSRGGFVNKADG